MGGEMGESVTRVEMEERECGEESGAHQSTVSPVGWFVAWKCASAHALVDSKLKTLMTGGGVSSDGSGNLHFGNVQQWAKAPDVYIESRRTHTLTHTHTMPPPAPALVLSLLRFGVGFAYLGVGASCR
eukprot:RCo047024